MDPKTMDAYSALGVEIDAPKPEMTPEQAKKLTEQLRHDPNKVEVPADGTEPKAEEPKVGDGGEGGEDPKSPDMGDESNSEPTKPEDKDPEIINDKVHPDTNSPEVEPTVDVETDPELDLEDALKSLEEMSNESLDNIQKTSSEIEDKARQAAEEPSGSESQSKTLKEIVDLNVKQQQELAIQKMTNEAKDKKIAELTERINTSELDDSRLYVPDELRGVTNYYSKYKETSNETFKYKALQEAIDMIEELSGKPLE